MQPLGLSRIYVRQAEAQSILPYLLENLKEGPTGKKWDNREKGVLIYDLALFWLRHSFTLEIDKISERLGIGLNLTEHLFEIIKWEKNPGLLGLAGRGRQNSRAHRSGA